MCSVSTLIIMLDLDYVVLLGLIIALIVSSLNIYNLLCLVGLPSISILFLSTLIQVFALV